MGSRKPSKRTAQPSHDSSGEQWRDVVIATLREAIGVLRAQLEAQSKLLASKDLQIQMVLEDRFFRPVVERDPSPAIANTAIEPATLTDSTQFPTEGDKEAVEEQDKAIEDARKALEEEFAALETEQAEAHAEDVPEETEAPVEEVAHP